MKGITNLQLALLRAAANPMGVQPRGATEHASCRLLARRGLLDELPANQRRDPFGRRFVTTAAGRRALREQEVACG